MFRIKPFTTHGLKLLIKFLLKKIYGQQKLKFKSLYEILWFIYENTINKSVTGHDELFYHWSGGQRSYNSSGNKLFNN